MSTSDETAHAHAVYLSGPRRGQTDHVAGTEVLLGRDGAGVLHAVASTDSIPGGLVARLRRAEAGSFQVETSSAERVQVGGEPAEGRRLSATDLIETPADGSLIRVRFHSRSLRHKLIRESLSDCADCATYGAQGPLQRAGVLTHGLAYELRTQISPASRIVMTAVAVAFAAALGLLWRQNAALQDRVEAQAALVDSLAMTIPAAGEAVHFDAKQLDSLRGQLQEAQSRLADLELRADSRQRVIASASQSVIFLQGAFGFIEPVSGETLRLVPGGLPGQTQVRLGGDTEPFEVRYTGTGFVASADGHVVTNRHVALPWEFDEAAKQLMAAGLTPVMRELRGYLPGQSRPFDVAVVEAHESADVALLVCDASTAAVPHLELSDAPVDIGTEVIVLGYPLGIQAMLARAESSFLDEALRSGPIDFWVAADLLAGAGYVRPLATVGVIGQVTSANLVYDANTTHGGSGGPVVGPDGRVLAVNAAIMPGFSGSNLGVPARRALELLARAAEAKRSGS